MTAQRRPLGAWPTVRLVAAREMRERARTTAFRVSAVVLVLGAIAIAVFPSLINSTTTYRIGVVGDVPSTFEPAVQRAAQVTSPGASVEISAFDDIDDAEQALTDDDVEVIFDAEEGGLVWRRAPKSSTETVLDQAATELHVQQVASGLGLDDDQIKELLAPAELSTRSLLEVDEDRGTRVVVALAGTILLFLAIQVFGGFVLSGVIEEKTSRIAEVMLAQVPPQRLLAGKILGIGTLALAEVVVVVVAAMTAGQLAGTIPLPSVGLGAATSIIGWFVLGFAFYSVLFGSAGALVDRPEDAQAVTFPILMPLVVGYVYSLSTISNPDNVGTTVLSFIPFTSAVAMPVRMQLGIAPIWQVAVSVLIMVATMAVLLNLAGRVYAGGLLRTGARVTVRDALAAAEDIPDV